MFRRLLLITACLVLAGCDEYNSDNIFLKTGPPTVRTAPAEEILTGGIRVQMPRIPEGQYHGTKTGGRPCP